MKLILLFLLPLSLTAQTFTKEEINRWEQQAKQVTIIRDNWGIPHIYGKTDADCVFGLLYAQCEDDFKRVEANYIDILGRSAEISGEKNLYNDLYTRLLIDSAGAKSDYINSAAWLKKLLNAFADGVNYYLYKHPSVKPALLTRFEPWFQLMWTDGSIAAIQSGGLTIDELKRFYTNDPTTTVRVKRIEEEVATGSNGFALAPSRTASGNAILYINPHVTFYFRPEVHVISEEGLNAYGAVTWGQLFVYQGFNEHCGWMHTSGYSDVADLYAEKISKQGSQWFYQYEKEQLPVKQRPITLSYKDGNEIKTKTINTWYTHHGPVMGSRNGNWLSVKANNRSMTSLMQSWQRTKANGFDAFKKTMELLSNASNNTVFADDKGNIAYWHGNYIPRRDTAYEWNQPVDGTTRATEWKGQHTLNETIHLYNPASGFIQNCNSTPFTASGSSSPKKEQYPAYMSTEPENFRGITAARLMAKAQKFTIDSMIANGYNTTLSAFQELIPALINRYEIELSKSDSVYTKLAEPISVLKNWDLKTGVSSIATTLAIEWIQRLVPLMPQVRINGLEVDLVTRVHTYAQTASADQLAGTLLTVVNDLTGRYGSWKTPWGDINRYQRLTGNLQETYDDNKPSLPVGMAASTWGCLPSFVSRYQNGSMKRYGYNGNSFICAVEFGKKVKAKSLLAGGESGDPSSKYFGDQAEMYTKGIFKEVLFYKEDVLKHAERTYRPGQ
ncbi:MULTISPECIES: penicillin acylase family protein [Niastella]|uniref:Penicillin acylase family protein n=1 Tax=Niastella soli TaxID=2821487 RepID=A0ABS3YPN5_9BACT|nr:penicillin acylase family protein [Niastella soli]MBO9199848.1 penicillin acylase family protein [Niastella soli]